MDLMKSDRKYADVRLNKRSEKSKVVKVRGRRKMTDECGQRDDDPR